MKDNGSTNKQDRPAVLPYSFYRRPDVVQISRELIGKYLCTEEAAGKIVETEAYCGCNDRACHANNGKRTARTEVMYQSGGVAYVYLCYGIHHLFNVVTNREGMADAVLIRAVEPADGVEHMLKRRGMDRLEPTLTAGPGRLTQALGISVDDTGTDLVASRIRIEDRGTAVPPSQIESSTRIGVNYAGSHADRLWRFTLAGSEWIS